eukprot:747187-Hanusia_phi.AAC.1
MARRTSRSLWKDRSMPTKHRKKAAVSCRTGSGEGAGGEGREWEARRGLAPRRRDLTRCLRKGLARQTATRVGALDALTLRLQPAVASSEVPSSYSNAGVQPLIAAGYKEGKGREGKGRGGKGRVCMFDLLAAIRLMPDVQVAAHPPRVLQEQSGRIGSKASATARSTMQIPVGASRRS